MIDGNYLASDSVGDPMDENPNTGTTRIFIQNLNGLLWNKDGGKWPYVCETIVTTQSDIACFSELNTDTNRYDVRKIWRTLANANLTNIVLSLHPHQQNLRQRINQEAPRYWQQAQSQPVLNPKPEIGWEDGHPSALPRPPREGSE